MRRRFPLRAAAVSVGLALLSGGCGDDGGSGSPTSARPTSAPSTAAVAAETTPTTPATAATTGETGPSTTSCPSLSGASTERLEGPAPPAAMVLEAVTVDAEGCTDRVSFGFRSDAGEPPGYSVEYRDGPFVQDASGLPVEVTGEAFLVLRLEPASGFDSETGSVVYPGPNEITPGVTRFVQHVVETGDFEAVTTWVLGLSERRPFTVVTTGAPDHALVITIG